MKKLITILLIVISLNGISQTSKITGSWLMTKAETEEGIEEPYFITTFSNEGKMIVLDMEVGSWKYDKKTHSLILKSDFDEDFNGTGKIQSVSDTELIILKDNTTLYYTKVDEEKVAKANQNSKLVGTWRFQKNDWTNSLLKFELPDSFVFVETEDGMRTSYRGNWMYNPKQNNVIIMGLHSYVSGKNTIELLADEKLVLKNKDISIHATKEETSTAQVSRLDFTEHEFYTEDGDFKYYDDEEKLPWLNYYDLIMYLQNVNQLVYKYSVLIEDTDAFNSETLTAEVYASINEELASIDFIFYGYDRYNLPDDTELPPNEDYTNQLFPLRDDTFRIAGEEEITTAAGIFQCVVLEIIGDFDMRKKAWMIKDKPGVYAKIIEDKAGSFGKYAIYELLEINEK